MDIEDRRKFARDREKGKPRGKRIAPPKLVEGAITHGWRQALNALAMAYPNRIPAHAL